MEKQHFFSSNWRLVDETPTGEGLFIYKGSSDTIVITNLETGYSKTFFYSFFISDIYKYPCMILKLLEKGFENIPEDKKFISAEAVQQIEAICDSNHHLF